MAKARRGRGEGSLQQLDSGHWRAWVSLGKDPQTGKRLRESQVFATKREALDWRDERRRQRDRPSDTTVGEWCEDWLSRTEGTVEPSTMAAYRRAVRLQVKPHRLDGLTLATLTDAQVEAWQADLARDGCPANTRKLVLITLRRILRDAVRRGKIPHNVAADVKPPKAEPREIRPLTPQEVPCLLRAAAADDYRAWYYLQLDAGLRVGESYALHWPEVDLQARTIRVERSRTLLNSPDGSGLKPPKTKRSRRAVPISPTTCRELAAHRERMRRLGYDTERGPVFLTREGNLLRADHFAREVSRVYAAAGIRGARPNDLRHTSATHLLCNGINIRVVSERLGHSNITTTLRYYASYLPGLQQTAADRMEQLFAEWHTAGTSSGDT